MNFIPFVKSLCALIIWTLPDVTEAKIRAGYWHGIYYTYFATDAPSTTPSTNYSTESPATIVSDTFPPLTTARPISRVSPRFRRQIGGIELAGANEIEDGPSSQIISSYTVTPASAAIKAKRSPQEHDFLLPHPPPALGGPVSDSTANSTQPALIIPKTKRQISGSHDRLHGKRSQRDATTTKGWMSQMPWGSDGSDTDSGPRVGAGPVGSAGSGVVAPIHALGF